MEYGNRHVCHFVSDTPRYGRTFSKRAGTSKNVRITGILVKLGVCAAAFALILVIRAAYTGQQAVTASTNDAQQEFDDTLGKLKFVQMPGILEVFAPSGKYEAGFEYSTCEALLDDTLLSFVVSKDQTVFAPTACRVKELITDDELGAAVCLVTAKDEELIYHGFSEISVEQGQQLAAGDYLGAVAAGGLLSIKANVAGRPVPPGELIDFGAEKQL